MSTRPSELPARAPAFDRASGALAPAPALGTAAAADAPGKDAPVSRAYQVLAIAASALLLAAAILVTLDRRAGAQLASQRAELAELMLLSQRLAGHAHLAAGGEVKAFDVVHACAQRFAAILGALAQAADSQGAPATPAVAEARAALAQRWNELQGHTAILLGQRAELPELHERLRRFVGQGARATPPAQRLAGAGQPLDAALAGVLRQYESAAFSGAVQLAQAMVADSPDAAAARRVAEELAAAHASLRALLAERPAAAWREAGDALRDGIAREVDEARRIAELMETTSPARRAARAIGADADLLSDDARRLATAHPPERAASRYLWAAVAAAALAFACLLGIGKVVLDEAERRAAESMAAAARARQASQRTQQAILKLLDEMGQLAQGDLTVHASINEELTGAVADAVNYAVGELRRLVVGVDSAASQLAEACTHAQASAGELLNASQRQSQRIDAAGASIGAITAAARQISERAAASARVGESALAAATRGSACVQRAITGIEAIRQQVHDAAKRMKRLGESSLEIGETVDLITEISSRTNVVALNAAIQANAAGAAGRGFIAVAEEVQSLAQRTAQAARQIDGLAKIIQAEAQDVTGAMERSTERVVEQTALALEAGEALGRIEQVSRELAELIGIISAATREQSVAAERVQAAMAEVMRISEMTGDGTRSAADRAAQLAGLARELQQLVAGFRVA